MKSAVWNRQTVSWALFDWGNSAFATTVMVVFFPVFFKQYWSGDVSATQSTAWLAFANTGASFVLAVLAPLLGTLGDRGGARLKFLLGFTVLGVATTAGLAFVAQGEWQLAAVLFALGSIGFWGGIIFYDSLLIDVAPREKLEHAQEPQHERRQQRRPARAQELVRRARTKQREIEVHVETARAPLERVGEALEGLPA